MQDHHTLNFGSSFAVQLVYRFDKKWRPYSHYGARIRKYQTSFSGSFTYNSLWKHKMSRRMKRFATTNAIHTT